jgi:hypothetical protein
MFSEAQAMFLLALSVCLFGGGLYIGHHWSATKVEKLSNDLAITEGNLSACGEGLNEVNKQFKANQQAAFEQKERADQAEKDAQKGRQMYSKALDQIDAEQAAARKEPGCAAQLEARICVALH